jgi:hypothetical protein
MSHKYVTLKLYIEFNLYNSGLSLEDTDLLEESVLKS